MITRPPFPSVIDSTLLSHFRACPRSAELEFFQHWKPRTRSVHLHAGAAYARGLEVAREAYFGRRVPEEEAIAQGLGALMQAYGDFECPPDSAKSLERMCGAFEFYFSQYPMSIDPAPPARLPGDRLGVEFSFLEPLGIDHPETGEPLLYSGRFDMICDYAGALYGEDDKTSSQLGPSWSKQWDLRSQFTAYCLTGEHEVLTPSGWIRIDQLSEGTPVMQWGEGQLSYTVPTAYHKLGHNGPLHNVTGKVSFRATPDHRVLVYDSYADTYKTFLMKDLPRNSGALRFVSAGWKQDGEVVSADILRLLVAVQADGSWLRNSDGKLSGVRFHFTKERKFTRLEEILTRLSAPRKYWNTKDYSLRVELCPELEFIEMLLGPNKLFGPWLLELSGESLRVVMDELRHWDGHFAGSSYITSEHKNADWVMTIAALCGMRGSLVEQAGWKSSKPSYKVYFTETHRHSVHLHQEALEHFEGSVYCLTVPSSYFLIRHNGMISVTGNCWGARKAGIPLEGFLIRGVSILKTKYDTQQAITYRPAWQVDRWEQQMQLDVLRMIECWENGYFDYNLDESCNAYGGCGFRRICLSEPGRAQSWLEQDFERRRWDPVQRIEVLVEA